LGRPVAAEENLLPPNFIKILPLENKPAEMIRAPSIAHVQPPNGLWESVECLPGKIAVGLVVLYEPYRVFKLHGKQERDLVPDESFGLFEEL
jgi:hypothetical protein